jgi:hypothetical protein
MHPRLRRPRTSAERGLFAAAAVLLFYTVWTLVSVTAHGWSGQSYTHLIAPVAIQMFAWAFVVILASEILGFVRSR